MLLVASSPAFNHLTRHRALVWRPKSWYTNKYNETF